MMIYRQTRLWCLHRLVAASFFATALVLVHAVPALAQWNITRVADQASTGINVGGEAPSISGQEIAFFGNSNSRLFKVGPTGVPVTVFQTGGVVPDTNDPPTKQTFFQIFEAYSFSGNTFAFRGSTTGPTQFGAYAVTNTGPVALAGLGSNPALPESAGSFLGVDGNDVAFGGPTSIRVRRAGVDQVIANNMTDMPGADPKPKFSSFSAMDFSNGTVVFSGSNALFTRTGIYYDRNDGTGIQKLVDNTDTAPGGAALFSFFLTNASRLAISGNDVVFYAQVADGRIGIFLCRNFGPPQLIAASNPSSPTFLPGGTERADMVQGVSVSNGEVAFMARSAGNATSAIFATYKGVIERVIGTGAVLNGRTVDVPYGLNEMRSGNTIAFNVLFVENSLQPGIYRADRGQPAVSNSGMIVNGSFANGLNNWVPSGSVNVIPGTAVPGPAVQMTADGAIPGPAQISQTINTPNGSYMIFFDYRFTTTTGSLDLLINGIPIANIPAPPTVSGAFTRAEVLVNNTALMGQNNATFTMRLNPGSLSDIFLKGIFSPLFGISITTGGAFVNVKTDLDVDHLLPGDPSLGGSDFEFGTFTAPAVASVARANATESGSGSASALASPFGGVQWAMAAAAQATQRKSTGYAEGTASIGYIVSGHSLLPPVVNFQLNLTGVFDLIGNFSQQNGTEAVLFLEVIVSTLRALVRTTTMKIVLTPGTRDVADIVPLTARFDHINDLAIINGLVAILNPNSDNDGDGVLNSQDQCPVTLPGATVNSSGCAQGEFASGPARITFTPTPPNGPPDTSRRYNVNIQYALPTLLYGLIGEPVSITLNSPSYLEVIVASAFNGTISADFSNSFAGSLSTSTPGVQLVPAGLPLDCSSTSLQDLINIAPAGSTIPVQGTCNENILIRNEKRRITIDGSGAGPGTRATISGNGNAPVVNIRGKGILLQNFNITGGSNGVHVNRGSNAVLNNNVIQNNDGNGVVIDELAFAVLTNNTIQNNPDAGVFVSENATARIGFNADSDVAASFNTIQNNGVGVVVSNNSSGRIIGNTIQNNSGVGVQVLRDSHADIAGNTINNNGDGIEVGENSLVQLGEDSGTSIFESPNTTTSTNTGFGIKCLVGGTADGRIGSLTGGSGAKSFLDPSCTDSLSP
jgi:hypothetical protein